MDRWVRRHYTNWYLDGDLGPEPNNGTYHQPGEEPYQEGEDHAFMYQSTGTKQWGDGYGQHDHGSWLNKGLAEIPLAPNKAPTGTPTLTGDFKVGKTIRIDASPIKDTDNHEY